MEMKTFTLYFIDHEGNEIKKREYSAYTFKEVKEFAYILLAEDNFAHHIEIGCLNGSRRRHKVICNAPFTD